MIRQPRLRTPRGFTLVELLVVISIIVILIGILIPVIGGVRKSAYVANTKALIAQLTAQIDSYHNDFRGYPGPIPNTQLRGFSANNITFLAPAAPSRDGAKITMAENLYLGLMGGLQPVTPQPAAGPAFEYDDKIAGQGPRWLGPGTPRKVHPYGDNANITQGTRAAATAPVGDYSDAVADCDDSDVPEFLDRIPTPMPFLYLRARTSATDVVSATPAATTPANGPSVLAQYDLTQVSPYTSERSAGAGFIGESKSDDGEPRVPNTSPFYKHGFTSDPADAPLNTATTAPGQPYPYNIYAALRHPTLTSGAGAPVAKQKDGYILISPGLDRVYGTKDDITNFGTY
jgi:prepilin-type N-terminal cleavage/methylation domain-containing protein